MDAVILVLIVGIYLHWRWNLRRPDITMRVRTVTRRRRGW